MSVTPDELRFTDQIDWNKPDNVNPEGLRVFNVRCRVPLPPLKQMAGLVPQVARDAQAVDLSDLAVEMGVQLRDLHDLGHNGDGNIDLAEGDESEPVANTGKGPLISGIASSTSVDFFGTEMSVRALKMMAVQMMRTTGLVYLPRHNRGLAGSIEWDEVIGRTVHAEVVPTEQAAKAFNEAEAQWLLRVTIQLFDDEPLSQSLLRRISRGEQIGQSIGGWFTHLQVLQNEDGDVERVIVLGVELDHLAVTRAPANPDSVGLVQLRSALDHSAAEHRATTLLPRVVEGQTVCTTPAIARSMSALAVQERHLLSVMDNGDGTASIRLKINGAEDDAEGEEASRSADTAGAEPEVIETHQQIESACAKVERSGDRVVLSWDADADQEALATALGDAVSGALGPDVQRAVCANSELSTDSQLDTDPATGDDASATDARRSALPQDDPSLVTLAVAPSEEPAMSEQNDLTLDAIRSAITDAVTPLAERMKVLEAAQVRAIETPEPKVDEAPEADPALEAAEQRAKDAVNRAEAAEAALVVANRRPMRQGRSVTPSFGTGPAARTGYDGIVAECRSVAPTLAATAERCIATVSEANGAGKVTRRDCQATLSDLLTAAEADGIITDPNHRAVWQ